jgi:hypothetical protein
MAMMLSSVMAPALMTAPMAPATGLRVAASKMALVDKMCAAACGVAERRDAGGAALQGGLWLPAPRLGAPAGARAPSAAGLHVDRPRVLCATVRREGVGEETGGKIWDPLGISAAVSDEAIMWFRASELKHGRVAMVRAAPQPAALQPAQLRTGLLPPSDRARPPARSDLAEARRRVGTTLLSTRRALRKPLA